VLSIADPLGGVTDMEYDEAGRIILERRPSGAATSFAYDDNGNRSQITDARGGVFAVTFNDHHQVTKLVDAAGNAWVRDYDTSRRLVSSVDPTGARWELRYDGVGNPVAVVNPLGAIRTQTYVGGIVTETTDWKGQTTRVISDDFGRVIERVEPLGRRFGFRYDAVGNLVQVALPDGGMVEATYDGGGNLVRLTDPKGAATTYRYGPCRRLLERTDPNGHRTTYVWDTEPGRPLRVTNPKGEHYDFEYNAIGLVTREVSFDGRQYRYEYTPDGWCSSVINGALETIRIVRDPEGRMVEQHCSDGKVAKYAYDALGNVIEAVNDAVALTVQRDAVGRVVRETQADRWVSSQRDLLGDRLRLETSLGYFATWEHDPNGDPTRIATANNAVTQSQWDAGRNEIFRSLSDRVQLRQSFDVCGRLSTQRVDSVARAADANHGGWSDRLELVVDRIFGRDASGVPTSIDETWWGATRYTYDAASQLLRTLREVGESETFRYDSTGNITSQTVGENPATDLEYGPGNRLLRKGSARYHYDAQGRLIRKTEESARGAVLTWQYRWDVLDQLTTFTGPDGEEWHYAYDAFGRRVEKRGPRGGTTFVWDGDVIVHEVQAGKEWSGWLYSGQTSLTPIAKTVGANSFWVISDHLDTPREMVDDVGVVRWRLFGRSYGDGGPSTEDVDNPFRFQGQYRDEESGLHYSRFRYYDPDTGRFIQQDPIALVGSDNLYWYAPNPISWLDPFGLTTASCKSGDRGRAKAVADMKKAGFKIVGEEVTMIVGGARIRADFVAEKNGRLYVFEVKNGTGGLTENQTSSKAFNIGNPANQNGAIQTSGGSDPPGRVKPFTIDTDNAPARLGDRGDTGSATFAVLKYDGTPGSRVD
jgi:RHS repeat-associated protein